MFDGIIWLIVELILTHSWCVATSLVQNGWRNYVELWYIFSLCV